MSTKDDIVRIQITTGEQRFVRDMARKAEIGGTSQIRNGGDRADNLVFDQLIGQIGTAALHKYWFGHLVEYAKQRWYQNQFPYSGDGGHDITVANVDVKASRLKNSDKMAYHLLVRPKERYPDWVYVHALVEFLEKNINVYLTGWARTNDLPGEVLQDGPLAGAYAIPVGDLKPMMPLSWLWTAKK